MAVTHKEQYKDLTAVFVKTIKNERFLNLYRGFVPTVLGVIPYSGFGFFTYESLKTLHSGLTSKTNSISIVFYLFFRD